MMMVSNTFFFYRAHTHNRVFWDSSQGPYTMYHIPRITMHGCTIYVILFSVQSDGTMLFHHCSSFVLTYTLIQMPRRIPRTHYAYNIISLRSIGFHRDLCAGYTKNVYYTILFVWIIQLLIGNRRIRVFFSPDEINVKHTRMYASSGALLFRAGFR